MEKPAGRHLMAQQTGAKQASVLDLNQQPKSVFLAESLLQPKTCSISYNIHRKETGNTAQQISWSRKPAEAQKIAFKL